MKTLKRTLYVVFLFLIVEICGSWGFFAHQKINRLAVFTLPKGLIGFYKKQIDYLSEHAVDPDKRRYADSLEAPRHYLDADHYGLHPFDTIPKKWADAVAKFGKDSLESYGMVPWVIERNYYALVKAFKERDSLKILHYSADLGHYVGDAQYIEHPLNKAWEIVQTANSYKDSVLLIEARLNREFPKDRKYGFSQRNGKVERNYSEAYARAYHEALKGMVEQQMRSSILDVGSFWYSAWVDAGQPTLKNLVRIEPNEAEKKHTQKEGRGE
jgi:hypothetical protein